MFGFEHSCAWASPRAFAPGRFGMIQEPLSVVIWNSAQTARTPERSARADPAGAKRLRTDPWCSLPPKRSSLPKTASIRSVARRTTSLEGRHDVICGVHHGAPWVAEARVRSHHKANRRNGHAVAGANCDGRLNRTATRRGSAQCSGLARSQSPVRKSGVQDAVPFSLIGNGRSRS